eukprot:124906-Pleurochrysis_carterae.AAC.1
MAGRGRVTHSVGAAFDGCEAGMRLAVEGLTRVCGSMYGYAGSSASMTGSSESTSSQGWKG